MSYKIEPVKKLPISKKVGRTNPIYNNIIEEINNKPKGFYKITIEGKKIGTLYQMFNKRLKGNKTLKLYIRDKELFIEKTQIINRL